MNILNRNWQSTVPQKNSTERQARRDEHEKTEFHPDRTSRGNRHHRDSGRHASARAPAGAGAGEFGQLHQQPQAAWRLLSAVLQLERRLRAICGEQCGSRQQRHADLVQHDRRQGGSAFQQGVSLVPQRPAEHQILGQRRDQ